MNGFGNNYNRRFKWDVKKGASPVLDILIQYFTEKLNAYGLFSAYEDAVCFRAVIMELGTWRPGSIEDEDWQVLHIFKVL